MSSYEQVIHHNKCYALQVKTRTCIRRLVLDCLSTMTALDIATKINKQHLYIAPEK